MKRPETYPADARMTAAALVNRSLNHWLYLAEIPAVWNHTDLGRKSMGAAERLEVSARMRRYWARRRGAA